jgi:hypothetical protein
VTNCVQCSAPFEFRPRGTRRLTCSDACRNRRNNDLRNARMRKPVSAVHCLHCHTPFVPQRKGGWGALCSEQCRTERRAHLRQTVRRERYRALVAAGACQSVASDGSQGYRSFKATLRMLLEHPELRRQPPKPRRKAEPRSPGRILDLLRKRYPCTQHPWRSRAAAKQRAA